jgi:hypothetical protein
MGYISDYNHGALHLSRATANFRRSLRRCFLEAGLVSETLLRIVFRCGKTYRLDAIIRNSQPVESNGSSAQSARVRLEKSLSSLAWMLR